MGTIMPTMRLLAPVIATACLFLLAAAEPAAGVGQLTITDLSISEGDFGTQDALLFVTLIGESPLKGAVTVDYFTQDGSATVAGGDYEPKTGTLVFIGGGPQPITIKILSDLDVEPDETFSVLLTNPLGATILDGEAIVTILNDDEQVVDVSIDDVVVTEGDSGTVSARFDVRLAEPAQQPVAISYTTRDGSATAGEDYQAAEGGVTIMPGEIVRTIEIDVLGDTLFEGDETFELEIFNADGVEVEFGQCTILDDDQQPALAIGSAGVFEGDAGTTDAVFNVTLSGQAPAPVTVRYATRDGSATVASGDYLAAMGTLTFAPGEPMKQVIVEVVGDTLIEPDEMFYVDLSEPAGAAIDDGQGEGTILNDDQEPPVLTIDDVTLDEGDEGTTAATFMVELSRATDAGEGTVTVDYATQDGTAMVADGDYLPAAGTLTFAPGQTRRELTVEIVGDTVLEDDEGFSVLLSNPDGATISGGRGEGTILNDDREPPALTIDDVALVEGDDGTTGATFAVELSRATNTAEGSVTVDYTTQDGTATAADDDYLPAAGTLTFAPGQVRRELTVEIVGDTVLEDDEDFTVQLSNAGGATIADGLGDGTILNDDQEASRIRLAEVPSVAEAAGTVAVSVERFGGADRPARVTIAALAGTATAGEDFTVASRQLDWVAGDTGRRVFELEILDDSLEEDDETVVLRLSSPVDSLLVDPAERTLIILDDDTPMALEAVDDAEVSAEVDQEIELSVRATRDDGAAVEGATVTWSVEGDAELLDGERTPTDAEGLAVQRLQLGSTAGEVVVTANIEQLDAGVEFTVTVEPDLADATDPTRDPGDAAVARALDESCIEATGELRDMCDYLVALGDPSEQEAAIAELTPEEVAAQAELALGSHRTQLANIGSRLAALRGGATRGSVEQLAVLIRGKPLDLGGIRSAWASRHGDRRFAKRVDGAFAAALAGGAVAAGDELAVVAGDQLAASGTPRWGLFLNGRISLGERPTTVRETGFDFETLGLTAGADYRLSGRLVLGGAVGYLDTSSDLDRDGGKLDARGYSLSAYGSYTREKLYLDGVLSYGRNRYDLVRNIDLPQPFQGRQRFIALGNPDGRQLSASLGAGYDTQIKLSGRATAWSAGGYGSLSWVSSKIDRYTERDAGPFNLVIADQDIESLLSEAGVELAYAGSMSWGVLRPAVRLSYLHELEDDARLIRAHFADDLTANEFVVPTEEPDRDFFNLTAGLTATMARGRTVYLIYDTDLERDDLNVYTFTFGVRFEL